MKTTFRTTFDIARPDTAPSAAFDEVTRLCVDWASSRGNKTGQARLAEHDASLSLAKTEIGKRATIEIASENDGTDRLWALRLIHPDSKDKSLHWHAELGLRLRDQRLTFACWLYFVLRGNELRQIRRDYSRPRIVGDLLQSFEASAGPRLTTKPRIVSEADVTALVADLRSPERKRPLVFISCRNETDRPAIDTSRFAERLAGLAHVCIASSRFPSLRLRDQLDERFGCWDGAVRLYWPKLRISDNPFGHHLWTRQQLRELRDEGRSLEDLIFDRLCQLSAMVSDPEAVDFAVVETQQRHKLIKELRERGELAELADAIDAENRALQKQVGELEASVLRWQEQCEHAEAQAENYRLSLLESERAKSKPGAEPADAPPPPIKTVAAAVEQARQRLSERLTFALNGKSDVKNNPFTKPEDLFHFLEFLATTYHDARTGTAPCDDLDLACREACGWKYEPHQSKKTMKKYRDWYTTNFDGREFWLAEHAGTGANKDARLTIRVAFDWDEKDRKVIVGFIGQHQENDRTSRMKRTRSSGWPWRERHGRRHPAASRRLDEEKTVLGDYRKRLIAQGHVESETGDRILKSMISTLDSFNDVRNKYSCSRDTSR